MLTPEFLKQFKDSGELNSFMEQLYAKAMEQMLEGEMDTHLGYEKHSPEGINSGNSRNGKNSKTVKTTLGEIDLEVTLGTGIVKIDFDSTTVIEFYKNPSEKTFTKRIEFFEDKSIYSWNIKNLNQQKTWLKPEILWLDYSQFNFRCKSISGDWFEVIVNNENGQTYWIKKNGTTTFFTWEEYLRRMVAVDRLPNRKQIIRKQPSDRADEIDYEGRDCFQVKSLSGDWIEIFTTDNCDEGQNKTQIKSGWIKWRHGEELLINYYTTS